MGLLQRLRNHLSLFLGLSVFIVLLLAVYFVFMPVLGDQFLDLRSTYDPRVIIGLRIKEVPDDEIKNLQLEQWQQDYYSKFNVLPTVISLEYIYIPQKILLTDQTFCIDEIVIVSTLPKPVESRLLEIPLCLGSELHAGMNQLILQPRTSKAFVYSNHVDQFWYPLDSRSLKFQLKIKVQSDDDMAFSPIIQVTNTPPRWTSEISWSQSKEGASDTPVLEIKMTRPLVYIILFTLILIGVPFLSEKLFRNAVNRGSLWETILGLLLSLWSLTQILIPSYIGFPTLGIYIILFMYIYLILRILMISIKLSALEKIEGIRPKIAGILYGAGFTSYQHLANTTSESLRKILVAEGLQNIDPTEWIQEAGRRSGKVFEKP